MTRSHSHLLFSAFAIATIAIASPVYADETIVDVRYPRAVIARPLTLPGRVAVVGGDATGNHDLSAMWGTPIVGAGLTDELEVLVPYAFATRELEAKGSLGIDVGYVIARGALGGKLEAIARARTGYSVLDGEALPIAVGVHVQYNVTDWLAIISGAPGAQQLQIAPAAEMGTPVDVGLPLAIGVQPAPALYVQLDTKLAQLSIADSENLVIGRDTTPVALTIVYNALHALDLQAAVGTDLTNQPGDALTFLVGARYYAGRL